MHLLTYLLTHLPTYSPGPTRGQHSGDRRRIFTTYAEKWLFTSFQSKFRRSGEIRLPSFPTLCDTTWHIGTCLVFGHLFSARNGIFNFYGHFGYRRPEVEPKKTKKEDEIGSQSQQYMENKPQIGPG